MICSDMHASAAIDAVDAAVPSEERSGTALERQLARLERLAEAGMELIEALVAQGKGCGPKVVEGDVVLAFSRVSRAVRMAELLHRQLGEGAVDPAKASEEAAKTAEAERKTAHVRRVARIVERVAREHCGIKPSKAADYEYAARERLDDDDIYGLVLNHPIGELVAMICREFGLQPDWDALADEAWALREIESGAPGSPFLEPDDEDDPEDETGEAPETEPAPQVLRPRSFQDRLAALAHDPVILATARRESG